MPALTETLVRRARPRSRRYELCCASLRGFMLRVLPSGAKVYYVRYREAGRDVRERLGPADALSHQEARRRAQARLADVRGDAVPTPANATPSTPEVRATGARDSALQVRTFARRYFKDHVEARLKANSHRSYRSYLNHVLAEFADDRLDRITQARVERWHAAMRDRPTAANNALRLLSGMYTKAYEWGVLPRAYPRPTTYVRKFRERSRERFLSPAERRRLEEVLRRGEALSPGSPGNIDWGIAAAIRLLALTGMRRSEVLGLEWSMVDTRLRCIRLPDSKTGQRVVPLGTPVLRLLEKLEQRREPLCPYVIYSRNRTPLHATTIGKSWQRIRDLAGLAKVRLHDLRHSAASDAIMSGVPLAVVGKILGHSQPQTTARYAHISDSALAQAVERMSLSIAACGEPSDSKG